MAVDVGPVTMQEMDETTGEPNHYQLLGVPPDAPLETIRRAWFLRIRRAHPDRHGLATPEVRADMARRAAELNSAWMELRDEHRRLDYDLRHGLRPARCSACGRPGSLRRRGDLVVSACNRCWSGTSGRNVHTP